jgi:hypothetical protein
MHPSIDISISFEKLSAPVEVLSIDRRACRALSRANVYTVAEILLRGKPKLGSLKGIGSLTADRVWAATAEYLGFLKDAPAGKTASPGGSHSNIWEAPVSALPLRPSTVLALERLGCPRIENLVKARANDYGNLLGMGAQELLEIDQVLHSYLAQSAHATLLQIVEGDGVAEFTEPSDGVRPTLILQLPKLPERTWWVLEWRAMGRLRLVQIAARLGVSNSLVWDLLRNARERLRGLLSSLSPFLDHFEEKSSLLERSLGRRSLDLTTLVQHLCAGLVNSGPAAKETDVERMILLLRTLAMHRGSWFWQEMGPRWPCLIRLSCLVEPALAVHPEVKQTLQERARLAKRKSGAELAYLVLARAGKPMHWSEIGEQACQLEDDDPHAARTIHNSIIDHPELFVRVGPGTYALAEWGSQTVEPYPAIIASILRQENRPLPRKLIRARMTAIRPARRGNLYANLNTHPRFYRSLEKTFGLRGWLPPEEARHPSTPGWLTEDPASRRRVDQARAKGYDIERIIAEDRLDHE